MSKRSADPIQGSHSGEPFPKASTSGSKREINVEEMGEFEDAWEDEIESDEEIVNAEESQDRDEDGMIVHPC